MVISTGCTLTYTYTNITSFLILVDVDHNES
jgi:hypothetical protein